MSLGPQPESPGIFKRVTDGLSSLGTSAANLVKGVIPSANSQSVATGTPAETYSDVDPPMLGGRRRKSKKGRRGGRKSMKGRRKTRKH